MRFVMSVNRRNRRNGVTNETIRREQNIYFIGNSINDYRIKYMQYLNRTEDSRLSKLAVKYKQRN